MTTTDRFPIHSELQVALEFAAETIATMPRNVRAGWVCYLLEALEALLTHDGSAVLKEDFEDWLALLTRDLQDRTERGGW